MNAMTPEAAVIVNPFWMRDALPAPFRTVFTTRIAGTSNGLYESLNLGLHVGDDPRRVRENRKLVMGALGLDSGQAVVAQQIHGATAALVGSAEAGRGSFSHADAIEGVDALVTRERKLPLMCLNADCLLIALADPQAKVLAVIHAGWRGLAKGVIESTLATMRDAGASLRNLHAAGSPAIGPCCFEVGAEVLDSLGAAHAIQAEGKKALFDLRSAARQKLEAHGLASENIVLDPACTCCRDDQFFSHRRVTRGEKKQQTGRMALIAWIE